MYGFADRNVALKLKEMAGSAIQGQLGVGYQTGGKGAQLYLVSPIEDIPAARIEAGTIYLGRGKAVLYRVKDAETLDETADRELEKINPAIEIEIFNPFPIVFCAAASGSGSGSRTGSSEDPRSDIPRIYQAWRDAYGYFHLADTPTKLFGKLTENLTAGTTAEIKVIDQNGEDKLDGNNEPIRLIVQATPLQKETIEANTRVIVEYVSDEGNWFVTAAACEPDEEESTGGSTGETTGGAE